MNEQTSHNHESEKFNIVKMGILPKLIYRFNTIPTMIPAAVLSEIDKLILIWKFEGHRTDKTALKRRITLEGSCFPISKPATQL